MKETVQLPSKKGVRPIILKLWRESSPARRCGDKLPGIRSIPAGANTLAAGSLLEDPDGFGVVREDSAPHIPARTAIQRGVEKRVKLSPIVVDRGGRWDGAENAASGGDG